VLITETGKPLRVGAGGGPHVTLEPAPRGGVRADQRPVGSVWRAEGGLHRVEGLRLRGDLEVRRVSEGLQVVNRVPLEHYVAGTLGREMYPGWEAEALKAQAVVTRTYVLHRAEQRGAGAYDVEADTRGQVYGGVDAESPAVQAAVQATRGEFLAWEGRPILAVFHSASGGRTASSEEVWGRRLPYLQSIAVEHEEDSPDTYWRATVSRTKLGRALAPLGVRVGPIRELRVVERSPSGRVRSVAVRGRDGETEIEARALRRALGAEVIRSTLFETREDAGSIVLVGSGHGHGVGMSQWGAQGLARQGASYRDILATFYPGTTLARWGER
jgi:stage II sporulation protein D